MSSRLDQSRPRVQNMIGDTRPSDSLIEPDALDEIIARHVQLVAADLDMPMSWSEDAVALVANDYDYDLPATLEYRRVALGRRSSDGYPIWRVSPEILEAMRLVPVSTGDPYLMAFLEQNPTTVGNPQKIVALFYPTPKEADTVDLLIGTTPALISGDSSALPFGELGVRCVECRAAAEALARIPAEPLVARKIDKGPLMSMYAEQAAEALVKERVRLRSLTLSGSVGR